MAKIEVEYKDLEAVKAAVARLGWEWCEGKRSYAWYGRFVGDTPMPDGLTIADLGKCDHAARVPGCSYEVGFSRTSTGTWRATWDWYCAGGLDKVLGANGEGGAFRQAYAVEKAKLEARKKGMSVVEQKRADGSIRLVLGVGR